MKKKRSELRKKAYELIFQSEAVSPAEVLDIARVENPEFFANPYVETVVLGVGEKKEEIDAVIEKYLRSGWSIRRLSRMAVCAMRLAIYEIMYLEDVPNGTAINEAVEILKAYGDEKDPAFVNGILASVLREEIKE